MIPFYIYYKKHAHFRVLMFVFFKALKNILILIIYYYKNIKKNSCRIFN